MVYIGVSTSQVLPIALVALSLLVWMALLWMNHQTSAAALPVAVLQQAGVACPVDSVSGPRQADARQMPARAPPTFHLPSILNDLDAPDPVNLLMARPSQPVDDSAEDFR